MYKHVDTFLTATTILKFDLFFNWFLHVYHQWEGIDFMYLWAQSAMAGSRVLGALNLTDLFLL